MMKLPRFDEPIKPDFDKVVRQPGQKFLLETPNPTSLQWNGRDYWRKITPILRSHYKGICSYSCYYIHEVSGDDTIEHFKPKSLYPNLAYEWSNYRYVCGKLNNWKRINEDVLDPFEIEDGWFYIEFPSLFVKANKELAPKLITKINNTIKQLKLNSDDPCIRCRQRIIEDFCSGKISFDYLRDYAPFVGREIERQGLAKTIWEIMSLEHLK